MPSFTSSGSSRPSLSFFCLPSSVQLCSQMLCKCPSRPSPPSVTLSPLLLGGFTFLLIVSHFVSPSKAFILQELPLYRNIRTLRHITPPEKNSLIYGGQHQPQQKTVPMPASLVKIEGGTAIFFVRPSRAFDFFRMSRLQQNYFQREALERLAKLRTHNLK